MSKVLWVAVYEHRFGIDHFVFTTDEGVQPTVLQVANFFSIDLEPERDDEEMVIFMACGNGVDGIPMHLPAPTEEEKKPVMFAIWE
jgi:hypothetical protein